MHETHFALLRHISLNASYIFRPKNGTVLPSLTPQEKMHGTLEFYVQWQSLIRSLNYPRYQIENVTADDIVEIGRLHDLRPPPQQRRRLATNARPHRSTLDWNDLYTIDPQLAREAWEMAHEYGYSYPGVRFEDLVCLDKMPQCQGGGRRLCPRHGALPGSARLMRPTSRSWNRVPHPLGHARDGSMRAASSKP